MPNRLSESEEAIKHLMDYSAQLQRDCAEVIKLAPRAPWLGAETAEQRAERERVWNETQKDGADE